MKLETIFRRKIVQLFKQYGHQGWWPRLINSKCKMQNAKFRKVGLTIKHHPGSKNRWILRGEVLEVWEVGIGAILTQNTAWSNVEKALMSLAQANVLTPQQIIVCPTGKLELLIRPAGYYKQKAKKLKILAKWFIKRHAELDSASRYRVTKNASVGILNRVQDDGVIGLRYELLALWGVGPETADTILLYGFGLPVFVVDAYTRRLLVSLSDDQAWLTKPYDEVRGFCESAINSQLAAPLRCSSLLGSGRVTSYELPATMAACWQESHALIVQWGKSKIG